MKNLAGKVAVVTGVGSGIGQATAAALAREEVTVAACDINEVAARQTAEAIDAGATAHHVDVGLESAIGPSSKRSWPSTPRSTSS